MENYEGGFEHFQIPCYVSTSQESYDPSQNVSYSIHNTLYLDVICPSVRPEIITLTNPATRVIDFGKTSIGHKCIQKITIKNISNSIVEVRHFNFNQYCSKYRIYVKKLILFLKKCLKWYNLIFSTKCKINPLKPRPSFR